MRRNKISNNMKRRWQAQKVLPIRYDDAFAMIAAGFDGKDKWEKWNTLPQYQRDLYRLKAKMALSIFEE